MATERGIWSMIILLPQMKQLKATALDALMKNVIPLVTMHFEYLLFKKHGDKNNPEALLHPSFVRKLASCTSLEDFEALANATKQFLQLSPQIKPIINKVKTKIKNSNKNIK